MEDVVVGKAVSNVRAKPAVVTFDNGERHITSGQWCPSLVADEVILRGNEKPISIGGLAKFAYGGGSISNKRKARKNLRRLTLDLIARGYVALVFYDSGTRAAQFVKLYNSNCEEDRQALDHHLAKMQERGDLLHKERVRAMQIAEATTITDAA